MLRVCKKIHNEIADLFYGQQSFRFTNTNGFSALAVWLHTIRPRNLEYLQHITVQLPVMHALDDCALSITKWNHLETVLERRGMRIPHWRYHRKHFPAGTSSGECRYDASVALAFRYLATMPRLQALDILVSESYQALGMREDGGPECPTPDCALDASRVDEWGLVELSDDDAVHFVEEHCLAPEYWRSLARLQQRTASPALKISLLLQCGPARMHSDLSRFDSVGAYRARMQCLRKYAKAKGYGHGYASWKEGRYVVEYDLSMGAGEAFTKRLHSRACCICGFGVPLCPYS